MLYILYLFVQLRDALCLTCAAMHFSAFLQPYAWLWWTAGFLYNPLIKVAETCAPDLKPHMPVLRTALGVWNLCFSAISLLGFLATCR